MARHQEHNILQGISVSLTRRKIQRCQRRLGNGHDVELHVTVARLYQELGEDTLALESYSSAVRSLLQQGIPLSTEDSDQLIGIYKHILALSPWNSEIIQKLGQEYLRRGLHYRAVELHTSYAERYAACGEYQKATEHYQQIFAIEPGSITARVSCANLYCQMEDFRQAAREYERIGDIYFEHQRFDGALEYYEEAAKYPPENDTIMQKIEMTRHILNGTLIPQAQASLQRFHLFNHDHSDLKRSLAEKERIEQELRQNIDILKQRYRQSVAMKNTQLRSTQKRLEELSTYVAVFKDHLEQIACEKQKLQQQLEQEIHYKHELGQKLETLNQLEIHDEELSLQNSSTPVESDPSEQTTRLVSAVEKLSREKARLERRLQQKIEHTTERETQVRYDLEQQTAQGNALTQKILYLSQERQEIERQLQQQFQKGLRRERFLQAQMKQLIGQHKRALQQIVQEKDMFEKKYRTTQERMNLVETDTMATLEQLRGELSRQCEMEHHFSEKFHTSLKEISRLLYNQEQEIQKLEQL